MHPRCYVKEIAVQRDTFVDTERKILFVSRCLANVDSRS